MQESCTSAVHPAATQQPAPLHDDIAQCAWDLWVQYGCPAGRDLAIWLEAEQRLRVATAEPHEMNLDPIPWSERSSARPARATVRTGAPVLRAASLPVRPRATPIL
jgi:Protein of unknown function (DUF2934)